MGLQDVQWGSRLPPLSHKGCTGRDSGSESAIMHFLRVSFILSVLPTVFLQRLSFRSAKLCRNWLPGLLSPGRDCTLQHSASFCGAVCRSQQPLVSALLFSTVSGGGKCFYFRPAEGKRDFLTIRSISVWALKSHLHTQRGVDDTALIFSAFQGSNVCISDKTQLWF